MFAISFIQAVLMVPLRTGVATPAAGAVAGSRRARRLLQQQVLVRRTLYVGLSAGVTVGGYLALTTLLGVPPTPQGTVLAAALGALAGAVALGLSAAGISALSVEVFVAAIFEGMRVTGEKLWGWLRRGPGSGETSGGGPKSEGRETRNEEA